MHSAIGRHIPLPHGGAEHCPAKRVLEELFCAAWTVRVGPLVAGKAKCGDGVSGAELQQMSGIITKLRAQTPSIAQLYAELGVRRGASPKELKRAYITQALAFHPDKNRGDEQATQRFQRLSEVYDVLSSSDRRREYASGGPIHIPGCPHPHQWLEAEFGSASALKPLVGSLLLADPVDASELSPRASGDAALKSQFNTRVEFLRLRLEAELCAWKAGDRAGVLRRARARAMALARTTGGARILLAAGRAYVDKAEMVMGKWSIFGLPAAFKASVYFARRACGVAASAGPCWSVLRHFGEVTARLRKLQAAAAMDEKTQRSMLRLVASTVEMLRRLTMIEIDGVLDEVLSDVLEGCKSGEKLGKKEGLRRAEGVREMGRVFIKVAKEALAKDKTQRK